MCPLSPAISQNYYGGIKIKKIVFFLLNLLTFAYLVAYRMFTIEYVIKIFFFLVLDGIEVWRSLNFVKIRRLTNDLFFIYIFLEF
jgi:hypothetical protein